MDGSDEPFRLLVESVKDYAIFILDPGGHVLTWNPGAERIKGYRADEIIGKHFSIFYPPEDIAAGKTERELEIAIARRSLRGGGLARSQGRLAHLGQRHDHRASQPRGQADRLRQGHARSHRAPRGRGGDAALPPAGREREGLRDLHPGPGRPRRDLEPAPSASRATRADEIIGKHFSIFYPPEDIAAGKTERELEIAIREGRFEEEGWRVRKDGSRIWANVTITALRNPEGVLIGFAKVTRDLTDRRQAEEARRAIAAEKAALAEKARIQEFQERFLAILGHDLRNPLASIDMGTGILRQRATDPVDIRVMDRMRASSLRMSRMIEQILDLTRSRWAVVWSIDPQPFDLRDAIAHVVDELRAANPSRPIEVDAPPLPGHMGPRPPGAGVLEPGRQRARSRRSRPSRSDPRASGGTIRSRRGAQRGPSHPEGAPVGDLQSFPKRPARQPHQETAGLGLGLYISNEVVIAHGGRIDLQSSVTEGTTFQVRLPR